MIQVVSKAKIVQNIRLRMDSSSEGQDTED